MGWSWAAACGVQGRGNIVRLRAQLVLPNCARKIDIAQIGIT